MKINQESRWRMIVARQIPHKNVEDVSIEVNGSA